MDAAKSIRWRCRRGIKELDLILGRFVEKHLEQLDAPELEIFGRLLNQNDQDIVAWVCGSATPKDPDFARIVSKIRGSFVQSAAN